MLSDPHFTEFPHIDYDSVFIILNIMKIFVRLKLAFLQNKLLHNLIAYPKQLLQIIYFKIPDTIFYST